MSLENGKKKLFKRDLVTELPKMYYEDCHVFTILVVRTQRLFVLYVYKKQFWCYLINLNCNSLEKPKMWVIYVVYLGRSLHAWRRLCDSQLTNLDARLTSASIIRQVAHFDFTLTFALARLSARFSPSPHHPPSVYIHIYTTSFRERSGVQQSKKIPSISPIEVCLTLYNNI